MKTFSRRNLVRLLALVVVVCAVAIATPFAAAQRGTGGGGGAGTGGGGGKGTGGGAGRADAIAQPEPQEERDHLPRHPNVRDFGAKGDGTTDDTAALQAAIDAGLGGVPFARGTYRISRSLVVDLDRVGFTSLYGDGTATLVMTGPGPAIKFIGTHGGTASPATVEEKVWSQQRTPMVDALEIVGAHPAAEGIWLEGTMQAVLTRVTVRRALHGIHLFRRNRNVVIAQCHLYENRGIGLFLDRLNLHQVNITNCHISYNGGGGIVVRESEVRNLQIGTCDIESNMAADGPPTANLLIDCTAGTLREGAIVGCTLQHNHEARDSANIRFIGESRDQPQKVGNFTIGDNVLSDVAVNIHLQNARGVTITGNTFWKAFAHNLLVTGSSNIVLGANLFDRNPDYQPADSDNALLFDDCQDCTLSGLHVNHVLAAPAGLVIRHSKRINLTDSTFLNCEGAGLWLDEVEQSRVSDCLIVGNGTKSDHPSAIRATGGRGNMIVDNLYDGRLDVEPERAKLEGNVAAE